MGVFAGHVCAVCGRNSPVGCCRAPGARNSAPHPPPDDCAGGGQDAHAAERGRHVPLRACYWAPRWLEYCILCLYLPARASVLLGESWMPVFTGVGWSARVKYARAAGTARMQIGWMEWPFVKTPLPCKLRPHWRCTQAQQSPLGNSDSYSTDLCRFCANMLASDQHRSCPASAAHAVSEDDEVVGHIS